MQQRLLTVLSLIVFLPLAAFAARPLNTSERQDLLVSLNNPRAEVIVAYGRISQFAGPDRIRMFTDLSPSMRRDVWLLHLQYFIDDHEELTALQRTVVQEAVRLILSGAFSTQRDESIKFEGALRQFEARALAAFGGKLAYTAFAHLGSEEPALGVVTYVHPVELLPAEVGAAGTPLPDCECASDDDWCCVGDCLTSPTPHCRPSIDRCNPHIGCGWFWMSSCNGICGA